MINVEKSLSFLTKLCILSTATSSQRKTLLRFIKNVLERIHCQYKSRQQPQNIQEVAPKTFTLVAQIRIAITVN